MLEQTSVRVGLHLSQDSGGFVRRGCPACIRTFKVRSEAALVQTAFVAAFQHANANELPALPARHCPYCGTTAPADAFLTASQRGYIEACAKVMSEQVRHQQLRYAEETLTQNPYLTFLPVRPPGMPAEPLPEPDDLRRRLLMCCDEEIKLAPEWRENIFCHYCRNASRGR
jgi:predicted nucleic acid-binding Zn ribbon protein